MRLFFPVSVFLIFQTDFIYLHVLISSTSVHRTMYLITALALLCTFFGSLDFIINAFGVLVTDQALLHIHRWPKKE
jgi:hypothetical protein